MQGSRGVHRPIRANLSPHTYTLCVGGGQCHWVCVACLRRSASPSDAQAAFDPRVHLLQILHNSWQPAEQPGAWDAKLALTEQSVQP